MDQPSRGHRRDGTALLALSLLLLGAAGGARAQSADCVRQNNGWLACATPYVAPPESLWGEVRTAETVLPISGPNRRDVTNFNEFLTGESVVPWFMSLDVENGYVFVAGGYRLQVWDSGIPQDPANPVQMTLLGEVKGQGTSSRNFPYLVTKGEASTPLLDIDAPAGDDKLVAIVGYVGMGISIVDTGDKYSPNLVYQQSGRSMEEVYTARIGNTDYAFAAQKSGLTAPTTSALLVYDMSQAVRLGRCYSPNESCPGVFLGQAGDRAAAYVDGVDSYVVYSSGGYGYQILDVSDPARAKVRETGLLNQLVYGVALWSDGGKYYLALATYAGGYYGNIYDVSCIAAATGCSTAPPLLSSVPIRQGSSHLYVTFSRSDFGPFLFFGTDDMSGQRGYEREFLVDVSDPSQPRVINPPGYFPWIENWNGVWPGRGKFWGSYFFRAGHTVMDAHRLFRKPEASFNWSPVAVYPGTPVTLYDTSAGDPTSWTWTVDGGTAVSPPN